MSNKKIVQLLAGYSNGDAISNEARTLRDIFQSWGFDSLIVVPAKRILPELQHEALPLDSYQKQASPEDIILLHLSIGSEANEAFKTLPGKKALLYHNITPPEYLQAIHRGMARDLALGRQQLKELATVPSVIMADSQFNANELLDAGYPTAHVLLLVLNWSSLTNNIDRATYRRWKDGATNILFVGRCVPNKKIEHILFAYHFFQQHIQPNARMIYVGSYAGTEKYFSWLSALVRKYDMKHVELVGTLSQPELNAAYKAADLFLCMSEHEGFCIPLLEAMQHDIPILAYAAGAVPETMDGAGVLVHEKAYPKIGEMMGRITGDTDLKKQLVAGQQERLKRYKNINFEGKISELLSPLL